MVIVCILSSAHKYFRNSYIFKIQLLCAVKYDQTLVQGYSKVAENFCNSGAIPVFQDILASHILYIYFKMISGILLIYGNNSATHCHYIYTHQIKCWDLFINIVLIFYYKY